MNKVSLEQLKLIRKSLKNQLNFLNNKKTALEDLVNFNDYKIDKLGSVLFDQAWLSFVIIWELFAMISYKIDPSYVEITVPINAFCIDAQVKMLSDIILKDSNYSEGNLLDKSLLNRNFISQIKKYFKLKRENQKITEKIDLLEEPVLNTVSSYISANNAITKLVCDNDNFGVNLDSYDKYVLDEFKVYKDVSNLKEETEKVGNVKKRTYDLLKKHGLI